MQNVLFRKAEEADLPAIVKLLADDPLGASREIVSDPVDVCYITAFSAISADANQLLAVAAVEEKVIGCMQLSFIPGLSRSGMWRGQIESVRIESNHRGSGLGREFFLWAFDQFRERRCQMVQLTTDKARPEALRFYERLGFITSHEGLKFTLS